MKITRVSLDFKPNDLATLEKLAENSTKANVIRQALILLKYMKEVQSLGGHVETISKEGERTRLAIFM